ncbi:MAG: hypothetical protein KKD05_04805 [Candidatus Omnitrophica bacterium]|nr:hypothetical protein [Candidatus Omnitrophota bacterium]
MKNLFFFIPALILILLLSSKIDSYSQEFLNQQASADLNNHIFYKTFGEFRDYLSDLSYLQADAYFHAKGQTCKQENYLEQSPEHEHHSLPSSKKNFANPLMNIRQALRISQHRHLSGNEEKELIPWFYYALKLNPHNEQAYCVGGFWLATRLDKIDEAIKLLKDGIKNNPDSWKIYAELGEIYIMQKKDYTNAAYCFEQARSFAAQQTIDKFEKRVIYTFLCEAYKKLGKTEQALAMEKELDKIFSEAKPANNH